MRVDEGRNSWSLLAIKKVMMKMKARTVVGRGEESLLNDPGSEKEKEKHEGSW